MADSAFDQVTPSEAGYIRDHLLAGETMAEIRRVLPDLSARLLRRMRDEVFEPLKADPEKVKALANGAILNANEIVRWKAKTRRPKQTATQTEMFPA